MKPAQGIFLRRAKILIRVLLFVALVLVAALAAIENTQPVRLALLGYESVELGVFWWLLVLFVIGLIVGRLSRIAPKR